MRRRRKQAGTVYKKSGMWYLRYSDFRVENGQLERRRLCKQIGSTADMNKGQAKLEAERLLSSINTSTVAPSNTVKLADFIDNSFFPHISLRKRG